MPDGLKCGVCGAFHGSESAVTEHLLDDHTASERLRALAESPMGGVR